MAKCDAGYEIGHGPCVVCGAKEDGRCLRAPSAERQLAALRARHEKLVEGCKALVEVWRDTANYGTDPDKSAAERLLFDTVHAHADELNALLEAK